MDVGREPPHHLPVLKGPGPESANADRSVWARATETPWVRTLLGVPLFYKILIANAVIIIGVATAGTATTAAFVRATPERSTVELIGLLTGIGLIISVMVNILILRLALRPISQLEATAARVQKGDLDARVPYSPLADRDLAHLRWTFNGMLDSLATFRRQLRKMAARALKAEEEERKRIARELHDGTAQTLAALMIRLRLARGAGDAAERDALLDVVRDEIEGALEDVRRFARGLRPPALDELGLVPAIESHVRMMEEASGVEIDVDAQAIRGLLIPDAELALYRIVQEAISNAVRHANPEHVRVRVSRGAGAVTASVSDDGRGFDVDEVMAGRAAGLGLFGMKERAAYVGGEVEITSAPGQGTRIVATMPFIEARARAG